MGGKKNHKFFRKLPYVSESTFLVHTDETGDNFCFSWNKTRKLTVDSEFPCSEDGRL